MGVMCVCGYVEEAEEGVAEAQTVARGPTGCRAAGFVTEL